MTKAPISTAGAAATVAAVLVVIAGLLTLGMPSRARERRLDGLRVEDLSQLSSSIDIYWNKHSALPLTLDSLVSARQLDRVRSYRLCATFAQPSDTSADPIHGNGFEVLGPNSHSWRHGAGESCFDLTPPQKEAK